MNIDYALKVKRWVSVTNVQGSENRRSHSGGNRGVPVSVSFGKAKILLADGREQSSTKRHQKKSERWLPRFGKAAYGCGGSDWELKESEPGVFPLALVCDLPDGLFILLVLPASL